MDQMAIQFCIAPKQHQIQKLVVIVVTLGKERGGKKINKWSGESFTTYTDIIFI